MNKIPDHLYLPVTPAGWNYIRQMLDSRPHGEVRVLVDGLDAAVAQQIEQANAPPAAQADKAAYRPEAEDEEAPHKVLAVKQPQPNGGM